MIQTGELLLGKYRIGERLGEGGMGTVFKARDELLDRDVAIKVLRAELAGQPALLERFRSEAIALARLAHPGIAALHGLERDGDQFYMVMEFARGETLEARIRREGRLPWNDAVTITAAVCDALGHAHHLGVVHRDIKPANVMVSPSLSVKVMDFGIARITGQSRQTRHGNAVGTLHYMSPEQLRGEEVDGRTDLYALGAMLYEMVSGVVPFDADSDYELMQKQLNDTPPRLGAQVPGVPGTVERLTARAMAKDRGLRFNSAAEMRAALTSSLSTPDIVPEAGTADQPQPLHLDWRTWSAGAMVVVALALVFLAIRLVPVVYQTIFVVLAAYAILFLPLAQSSLRASIELLPNNLENIGRSLGKRPFYVFVTVILPNIAPGIGAALALMMLEMARELTATLMLAPTGTTTLATQVWSYTSDGEFAAAAPFAALLVVISIIPVWIFTQRMLRHGS